MPNGIPLRSAILTLCLLAGRPALADDAPTWAQVSAAQTKYAADIGIPMAFENHLGMRFVLIPPGRFRMGAPEAEAKRIANTQHRSQAHEVRITQPYYLQVGEVTNAQFRRIAPKHVSKKYKGIDMNADDLPVTSVDRDEAIAFLDALSEKSPKRRHYRLPTEAEWAFAARAGTTTRWPWGDQAEDGHRYERLSKARLPPVQGPVKPTSFKPNSWGVHDMLGNVFEYTSDTASPLGPEPAVDPRGPPAVEERLEAVLQKCIVRGGGFLLHPAEVWPWFRFATNSWSRRARPIGFRAVVPVLRPASTRQTWPCEVRARKAEDGTTLRVKASYEYDFEKFRPLRDGQFDLAVRQYRRMYSWKFEPPAGRRIFHDSYKPNEAFVSFDPTPFAKRIVFDVPLFRTLSVEGVFRGPEDAESIVWLDQIAADYVTPRSEGRPKNILTPDGKGRFRIENIPWMPGVRLRILAGTEDALVYQGNLAPAVITMPAQYKRVLKLPEPLKAREGTIYKPDPPSKTIGIGGGPPPATYEPFELEDAGSARLRCTHPDGRPLAGAVVLRGAVRDPKAWPRGLVVALDDVAITGSNGYATFPCVPAGKHTFELITPSRPRAIATLFIKADKETKKTLALPAPASIRLRVLAPSGLPAAWSSFNVEPASLRPWRNVDAQGVQRVGKMTGHAGAATLHNVPPGPCELYVYWMGHRKTVEIAPKAGETLDMTIRLTER